ncbi:MAG: hypothetical protein EP330_06345 [Deltaproteobacteria bacterium]|nr:MAG: hypothetical protein EP330_06345 [Deltaproteobacteria bacterium]
MLSLLAGLALAAPLDIPELSDVDVRVDGSMDEAAWEQGALVTDFQQYLPMAGGAPAGSTEIRMLHDERTLYIGVRVRDSAVPIRARVSARELINADDQIGLYLDPFAEGGSGYIFYLNAIGIQQDMQVLPGSYNMNWDTVFRSKGKLVGDHGYDLEIAMPFRSLKYAGTEGEQDWRLIITRKVPGLGVKYAWPEIERNVPRVFTQGHPIAIDPPNVGSGLEIRGELAVVETAARDPETDKMEWAPFGPRTVRPGLDLKYGITPNIGLGATFNPDFSQVENDETPIDVNQRFAFYFSERRPFFLDGAGFYADQASTLYSRSIVNPVYGLKLTGREGPFATGVLHALDRSPRASVHQYGAPGFAEEDVDGALATNSVGRLAVDVLDGGHVGVTFADKRLFGNDGLRGAHDSAEAQLFTPIGERWTFSAYTLHTLTGADDGPTLYGSANSAVLQRSAAAGFGTSMYVFQSTPGVRQETGFRTQSGAVDGGGGASWTFEPGGIVNTLTPGASASMRVEDEGDSYRTASVYASTVLGGLYKANVEVGTRETVEQGLVVPGRWFDVGFGGDSTRWLSWDADLGLSRTIDWRTLDQANRVEATLDTTLRPTAGLRLDTVVRHDRLTPDSGALRWASSVRTRATWQFTQQLGVRLIGQHVLDSEDGPSLTSSVLFTWLQHPGTALYLGYAETTQLADGVLPTHRTVFAKGTVLLRM